MGLSCGVARETRPRVANDVRDLSDGVAVMRPVTRHPMGPIQARVFVVKGFRRLLKLLSDWQRLIGFGQLREYSKKFSDVLAGSVLKLRGVV